MIATAVTTIIMKVNCSSFYAGDGVTVFLPEGFNPSDHLPSPAFVNEPEPAKGGQAHTCAIVPQFRRFLGKSIAVIETGDADLYGGGEVNGSLRRKGEFARYGIRVETTDGTATLHLTQTDGKLENRISKIRMGIHDGERIIYSDYVQGNTVSMEIPDTTCKGLNPERFRFTELEDYAVNKPVTLFELIKSEILKEQDQD